MLIYGQIQIARRIDAEMQERWKKIGLFSRYFLIVWSYELNILIKRMFEVGLSYM